MIAHQYYALLFAYMLLLPEQQAKRGNHANNNGLSEIGEHCIEE
jgi:hypothetical protein